jgi:hypothetical protein
LVEPFFFNKKLSTKKITFMVTAREIVPGVVEVVIHYRAYGDAGQHWKKVLGRANHGYGQIYIERFGADARRRDNIWPMKGLYKGQPADLDECPGAMFIWTGDEEASVEPVFYFNNRALGSDLGYALSPFEQRSRDMLWEVRFRFA